MILSMRKKNISISARVTTGVLGLVLVLVGLVPASEHSQSQKPSAVEPAVSPDIVTKPDPESFSDLASVPLPCRPTSDNGIVVGQTKVFDENSLRIMLQETEDQLRKIQAINPAAVAGAVQNIQGQRQADSALAISVSTLPGIILGRQNKPPESDTTAPTIPTAPAQLPLASTPPTLGLSAENLLAKQMSLSYDVINLRLLLERSLTDRIIEKPINAGENGYNPRAQTIVGFQVSIDTKPKFKNAVAEVEISIVAPTNSEAPSLMSLIPKDKTYNVATITKKSKVFNAGAVVQLVSLGGSVSSSKADTYLVQDTDTVALERDSPHVEGNPDGCQLGRTALTFGWQFRPVLDRKAVEPGYRQVYAMLSLPIENTFGNPFKGKVIVHTHWRRYNNSTGTAGDIIRNSSSVKELKQLVTRAGGFSAMILAPRVDAVKWSAADNGKVLVQVEGINFLPGTKITFGDKVLDSPSGELTIQNENLMIFKISGDQLALNDNAFVIGRYGPAAALRNRLIPPNPTNLTVQHSKVETVDAQTSRVTLRVNELRNTAGQQQDRDIPKFVYQPIVIVGDKVFGMPSNLRVKEVPTQSPVYAQHATLTIGNGHTVDKSPPKGFADVVLELTFDAPTALLRSNHGVVTVKDVFFGQGFSRDVRLDLGSEDFTASELIVLSSSGTGVTLAIRGTNFHKDFTISVFVGSEEFSTTKKNLSILNSTLLSFNATPSVFKGVKNLLINQKKQQDSDGVSVVLQLPSPPPLPRPLITRAADVSEGDIIKITLNGSNLNSIESGEFQGKDLKAKPSEDGKSMTIDLPDILVSKAGKKDLFFTLKNGGDFTYTLTVAKN